MNYKLIVYTFFFGLRIEKITLIFSSPRYLSIEDKLLDHFAKIGFLVASYKSTTVFVLLVTR